MSAAITAIEDGTEKITRSLLDSIATDWTAQRDYEARRKTRRRKQQPAASREAG